MGPQILYRYRGLNEHTLLHLEKGEVFFQSPLKFNDPFEVDLHCDFSGSTKDARAKFEEFVKYDVSRVMDRAMRIETDPGIGYIMQLGRETSERNDVEPTRAKLRKLTEDDLTGANEIMDAFWRARKKSYGKTFGICCFSELEDDPLMWAHYADLHRGVCLIIDTRERPAVDWNRYCYEQVKYSPDRTINLLQCSYAEAFARMMLTKADCWKYEREWRLITTYGEGVQVSSNRNILGVILGLRIRENKKELRERLLAALSNFTVSARTPWRKTKPQPRDLDVYTMSKDPRRFALVKSPAGDRREALGL